MLKWKADRMGSFEICIVVSGLLLSSISLCESTTSNCGRKLEMSLGQKQRVSVYFGRRQHEKAAIRGYKLAVSSQASVVGEYDPVSLGIS